MSSKKISLPGSRPIVKIALSKRYLAPLPGPEREINIASWAGNWEIIESSSEDSSARSSALSRVPGTARRVETLIVDVNSELGSE